MEAFNPSEWEEENKSIRSRCGYPLSAWKPWRIGWPDSKLYDDVWQCLPIGLMCKSNVREKLMSEQTRNTSAHQRSIFFCRPHKEDERLVNNLLDVHHPIYSPWIECTKPFSKPNLQNWTSKFKFHKCAQCYDIVEDPTQLFPQYVYLWHKYEMNVDRRSKSTIVLFSFPTHVSTTSPWLLFPFSPTPSKVELLKFPNSSATSNFVLKFTTCRTNDSIFSQSSRTKLSPDIEVP